MEEADYKRIEREIASDDSPVGIDARKTHVMILAKLEGIERRLDAIEQRARGTPCSPVPLTHVIHGVGAVADTLDEGVERLRTRGIGVDERAHDALHLLEKLTEPGVMHALQRIVERVEALEPLTAMATQGPNALATATDAFDEEVARASAKGLDVDAALRNGLAALLYLGQRISTNELEALGTLLRSDVLHPSAVATVGRLGRALVAASDEPPGSVGPFGVLGKLGDSDARRSTAFALAFAKHFGAALTSDARSTGSGGDHHG